MGNDLHREVGDVNANHVTRTSRSWEDDVHQDEQWCGDEYSHRKVMVTLAKSTAKIG